MPPTAVQRENYSATVRYKNCLYTSQMHSLSTLTDHGGSWGTEQRVTGITSTPGTVLELITCAEANDFSITFNLSVP